MCKKELFESISVRICNKKKSITAAECFKIQNSTRSICRIKCRIDEKSIPQLKYVKSSIEENVFLRACPGSGKTEVVALKTSFELSNWDKIGGIAVLSFTQNSASVIIDRVREFIGVSRIGYPHYIGTIDSWIHSYIAHPFSHRITNYIGKEGDKSIRLVDSSSDAGFLNSYSSDYPFAKTGKILGHQYYWDFENNCAIFSSGNRTVDEARKKKFKEDEQWKNKQLTKELRSLKDRFWMAGFATYQDIEYISYRIISEDEEIRKFISKRFPFIIIDECQDLSRIQLQLLHYLTRCGSKLHFVGDTNQAIYEFKDVDPTKVVEFINNNEFTTNNLETNYRSNQHIVNVSQNLVAGARVIGTEKTLLNSSCICVNYKKNDIHKLPAWFEGELKAASIPANKSSIVTRGWSTVRKLRPSGNNNSMNIQEKIASSLHLWFSENRDAREDSLLYMGAFISNRFFSEFNVSRKNYYCPEAISSPLKWRLFIAKVLDECGKEEWGLINLSVNWTIWAKKIKNSIHIIMEKYRTVLVDCNESSFTKCKFIALRGKSSIPVIDTIKDNFSGENSSLRITTIHQVKGETLDAVMVVSSPDKRGNTKDGHWSFWLEDTSSEKARLAYVATSRAKHLLVWAVPNISKNEKKQLSSLGFTVVDLPS